MSFLFLLRAIFLTSLFDSLIKGGMTTQSSSPANPSGEIASESKKPSNTKRTGELAEAAFLHKAVGLGFRVTKPWGDSERYDFVLDSGRRLWRVQIKCTAVERAGGYHVQPIHFVYGKNKVVYTADDIDVLAAHVVPLDVWYVVPVAALVAGTSLRLYPDDGCKTARFEKYREGWDLFRGESAELPGEGEPVAVRPELNPPDEADPQSIGRFRILVWKPHFFGR
jgi:PD-(D/E)XK endonuclease